MKSLVLSSFWEAYNRLEEKYKQRARKTFRIWSETPFHPSLHFKCINPGENIWSVRITGNIRAIGIWEKDDFTWLWIGNHDDYEKYFG